MSISKNNNEPTTDKLVKGIRRPNWISRNVKQQVILVRDASSSMIGKKARDASRACKELLEELQSPINKEGFYVGVVDFNSNARVQSTWMKASELYQRLGKITSR